MNLDLEIEPLFPMKFRIIACLIVLAILFVLYAVSGNSGGSSGPTETPIEAVR